MALWSAYGERVDIQAPGTNVVSTWYTSPTATMTMSGTSMGQSFSIVSIANLDATFSSLHSCAHCGSSGDLCYLRSAILLTRFELFTHVIASSRVIAMLAALLFAALSTS